MQHGDDSKSHLVAPEQLEDENGIQFHIHQANGIRICDCFLLGLCKEGERCQLHHTRYPYHWQVMRKKKGVWQSVTESAQQHLEKLYSNVNDSLVTLVEKDGSKGKVNLNAMELYSFGPYGKIRRLSNTHDPQHNPHLHTEWHMYWLDETNWKEYEEPISQEIINAFESGLQSYNFSHEGQQYSLDLKNLIQTNSTTEQKSSIQRRPAYHTPVDMVPHLRQKEIMSRGLSTEEKKQLERHLFHGTSADSKNSICQMGFDPRLSGQHLAAFGKGSYFAKNAQYSNGFCTACKAGLRYMFLAKVLVGKSAVGNASYCQPPTIRSNGPLFDSCVDSTSSIYVIFNSSQSYPYFLIRYKLFSDPVAIDGS
ncbi:protein mono-ADP-ribosyltransferase TIPARP-like isoform X2 [Mauremys reevesii]|uniref:protein mono-ADP-ribosyltransferase TIPARP-like isoform X2 n=1 Tax=Mauremys reevesii TaxID=260615 RepID=UPI00193F9C75|nr:protein mono-ADP-ribosyltransferase TIPARP-like isoform X2 [Mauremys reevesii]